MAIPDLQDNSSYKSRKWAAFMLTSALVLIAGKLMPPAAVDGVIFGLISAMGVYCGANVTRDAFAMKHGAANVGAVEAIKDALKVAKDAPKDPPKEEEGS